MKSSALSTVRKEVYRRFPEFSGVRPKVQTQRSSSAKNGDKTYLLTFKTKADLPGNKSMPRWVRIVANENGKILKISTSR
jgi:hypothetical protein